MSTADTASGGRLFGPRPGAEASCRFVQMRTLTACRPPGAGARSAHSGVPAAGTVPDAGDPGSPERERKAVCVKQAHLGASALGIAALALGPLALASPAGPAAPATAAPVAAATVAAHQSGARPDPTFGPAQRRAAIADAMRNRGATADRLRLGGKEALVVKDVLRDVDGTEHVRYNRTYAGLPVIGGDLVVQQTPSGKISVDRATGARIAVPSTAATRTG